MKIYLSGPMSNVPHYNFPEFDRVTGLLRGQGWEVINPAEEDRKLGIDPIIEKSETGDPAALKLTWGDLLARDVKMIADGGIEGLVFLPGWTQSRGARLEAQVGLLCQQKFFWWDEESQTAREIVRRQVALELYLNA